MAKILCTQAEYDKLTTVLQDNPQFLADVPITYEIVETITQIPPDYRYDTETEQLLIYRHRYSGKEIHIVKDPKTFLLVPPAEDPYMPPDHF